MKSILKNKAIKLRQNGLSYSEILQQIPVAKSTLSLWLKSVNLSQNQNQRLTTKKLLAAKKGGQIKQKRRIQLTQNIIYQSINEIHKLNIQELFIIGIMLYWAEGAKQHKNNVSQRVSFSNSDPKMITVFLTWLQKCIHIPTDKLNISIYIHQSYNCNIIDIKKYWSEKTGFPISKFDKIYYKRHPIQIRRQKINHQYKGQVRIEVKASTNLNRQITGWIEGIYQQCRVV